MRTISELLGKHAGEEAWIFGKGPSLDGFDMQRAGALRICINESLLIVPEPRYFFAHDELPIQRVAVSWPEGCLAILQLVRAVWAVRCGIKVDSICTYEKRERELEILDWPPQKIAREGCLLGLTGTVHSAIHFCRLIGVTQIVLVGMEGRGGYAQCIGQPAPPGGGQHERIHRDSEIVATRLGIIHRCVPESSEAL